MCDGRSPTDGSVVREDGRGLGGRTDGARVDGRSPEGRMEPEEGDRRGHMVRRESDCRKLTSRERTGGS